MNRSPNSGDVDARLRDLAASDPPPTDEELATARVKLDAAIHGERTRRQRAGYRHRFAFAGGLAMVAAAIASTVLFARPAPLAAALAEYAEIVLQSEPLVPADGGFVLQQVELVQLAVIDGSELPNLEAAQVAYLIVEDRATRVGANGTIEVTSTPKETRFFATAAANAYHAAGLAELDGIGITTTVLQESPTADLPSDPDQLESYLRDQIRLGGSDITQDAQLFNQLATILADPVSSAETRAAAALLIASVDGVRLVDHDDAAVIVALEYVDLGVLKRTLELDLATAHLTKDTVELIGYLDELDIPAGTIISQARYEPLKITTSSPPNR